MASNVPAEMLLETSSIYKSLAKTKPAKVRLCILNEQNIHFCFNWWNPKTIWPVLHPSHLNTAALVWRALWAVDGSIGRRWVWCSCGCGRCEAPEVCSCHRTRHPARLEALPRMGAWMRAWTCWSVGGQTGKVITYVNMIQVFIPSLCKPLETGLSNPTVWKARCHF